MPDPTKQKIFDYMNSMANNMSPQQQEDEKFKKIGLKELIKIPLGNTNQAKKYVLSKIESGEWKIDDLLQGVKKLYPIMPQKYKDILNDMAYQMMSYSNAPYRTTEDMLSVLESETNENNSNTLSPYRNYAALVTGKSNPEGYWQQLSDSMANRISIPQVAEKFENWNEMPAYWSPKVTIPQVEYLKYTQKKDLDKEYLKNISSYNPSDSIAYSDVLKYLVARRMKKRGLDPTQALDLIETVEAKRKERITPNKYDSYLSEWPGIEQDYDDIVNQINNISFDKNNSIIYSEKQDMQDVSTPRYMDIPAGRSHRIRRDEKGQLWFDFNDVVDWGNTYAKDWSDKNISQEKVKTQADVLNSIIKPIRLMSTYPVSKSWYTGNQLPELMKGIIPRLMKR